MSVRFKRVGSNQGGSVSDHNDLLNKGVRTHAEIDAYLEEIDNARGNYIDLGARIEDGSGNPEILQEVVDARVDKDGIPYLSLKARLDATQGIDGGDPALEAEIADARGAYPSLNDRINDLTPKVNQVDKIGITASQGTPYTLEIPIPVTVDYKVHPVRLLKFKPGTQNVVRTEQSFDNADATSFIASPEVVFDGKMHLSTLKQTDMTSVVLGTGTMWSGVINKNNFKTLEKIEVI